VIRSHPVQVVVADEHENAEMGVLFDVLGQLLALFIGQAVGLLQAQ
jgi:hypothetical protein